jgi:hypothetical protein
MLAGDFNEISSMKEKRGGVRASERGCNNFKDRINSCKLLDMGSVGPKFTWRGPLYHGGQRIFERLDRALCNDLWRLDFPNGFVKVLTCLEFLDHHPILISPVEVPHPMAPKQFRFESAWILNDSYKNMLQQCWNEEGDIVSNLQNVRRDVQEWKIHNFNQVIKKKTELVGRIAGIQRSMQAGNNSGGLRRLDINCKQS